MFARSWRESLMVVHVVGAARYVYIYMYISIYIYIYIYIYLYIKDMYVYIYIYNYLERDFIACSSDK